MSNCQKSRTDLARLRLAERWLRRLSCAASAFAGAIESMRNAREEHIKLIDHHDRKKGNRFEDCVESFAKSIGLDVRQRTNSKHDRVINGLRTQIKRKDTDRVSLVTTPMAGRDYCGYMSDDWEVLVLSNKGTTYVIPVAVLLLDDGLRVRNHIDPLDYAEWINRWDVFGPGFCVVRESQRSLFGCFGKEATDGR